MILPELLIQIFFIIISCLLLISGLFLLINKPNHLIGFYLLGSFFIEIADRILPHFFETNLYLFSVSYYLNFAYLTYYYFKNIFQIKKNIYIGIIAIGSVPMLFKITFKNSLQNFEAYDWLIYDGWILVLCLISFFEILQKSSFNKNHLLISFGVLSFFGLDFSLAIAINYLVHGNPSLVLWVWALRACILLAYFLTLSICTWKILKKA